jgi:mono/diheme cytochrome c family protein
MLVLAACSRSGSGDPGSPPAQHPAFAGTKAAADRGAQLYEAQCIACHQPQGRGLAGVYPSLAGSPVVLGDPRELARWIVRGVRPASMPAGRYPTQMPHFGWMTPADAAALATYLRGSFGNHAPPVTPEELGTALAE